MFGGRKDRMLYTGDRLKEISFSLGGIGTDGGVFSKTDDISKIELRDRFLALERLTLGMQGAQGLSSSTALP